MKITSREKRLIVILVFVALAVYFFPGEEEISLNGNSKISKTVINILIAKFKYIKPFKQEESTAKNNGNFTIKRNIFQYGTIVPDFNKNIQQTENKEEKNNDTESSLKNGENILKGKEGKALPEIDFKVIGIIKVADGTKAIVITKGPELFVFKEGDELFDKFILKSIENKTDTFGFKGFKDEKTINLDNKGGF